MYTYCRERVEKRVLGRYVPDVYDPPNKSLHRTQTTPAEVTGLTVTREINSGVYSGPICDGRLIMGRQYISSHCRVDVDGQMREVIEFCQEQPEIRSWLDYFDDSAEEEPSTGGGEGDDGGEMDDRDISRQVLHWKKAFVLLVCLLYSQRVYKQIRICVSSHVAFKYTHILGARNEDESLGAPKKTDSSGQVGKFTENRRARPWRRGRDRQKFTAKPCAGCDALGC